MAWRHEDRGILEDHQHQLHQQIVSGEPFRDLRVHDIGPLYVHSYSDNGCCRDLHLTSSGKRRKHPEIHNLDDDEDGDVPKRQKTTLQNGDIVKVHNRDGHDQSDLAHACKSIVEEFVKTKVPESLSKGKDMQTALRGLKNDLAGIVIKAQSRSDRDIARLRSRIDVIPRVILPEIGVGSMFRGRYNWGFDQEVPGLAGSWQYTSEVAESSAQDQANLNTNQVLGPNPTAAQVLKLRQSIARRANGETDVTDGIEIVWVPNGTGYFPNPFLVGDHQQPPSGSGGAGNPRNSHDPQDDDDDNSEEDESYHGEDGESEDNENSSDDDSSSNNDDGHASADTTASVKGSATTNRHKNKRGKNVTTTDHPSPPEAEGSPDDNDHDPSIRQGAEKPSNPNGKRTQVMRDAEPSPPEAREESPPMEGKNWYNLPKGADFVPKSVGVDGRPEDNPSQIIPGPSAGGRTTRQSSATSTGSGSMGPPPTKASSRPSQTPRKTSTPATTVLMHEYSKPKPAGNKHAHANKPKPARKDDKTVKENIAWFVAHLGQDEEQTPPEDEQRTDRKLKAVNQEGEGGKRGESK